MNSSEKKESLLLRCDQIISEIQKYPDMLSGYFYKIIHNFCCIYLAWNHSGGKEGWAIEIPFVNHSQAKTMEGGFQSSERLFSFFQLGGGWKQQGGGEPGMDTSLYPLYESYQAFQKEVEDIRVQWNEIETALGVVKAENEQQDIFIQKFFILLTQELALWISKNPIDDVSYSFFKMITDLLWTIVKGKVYEANTELIHILNSPTAEVELLGTFFLQSILYISPEMEEDLDYQFGKNSQSICAGILLWIFYHFASQKNQDIVREVFRQLAEFNGKEFTSSNTLFPTFSDIEILHDLQKQKDFVCRYEIQRIVKPLQEFCILSLAFEWMNTPLLNQDVCRSNKTRKIGGGSKKRFTRKYR